MLGKIEEEHDCRANRNNRKKTGSERNAIELSKRNNRKIIASNR